MKKRLNELKNEGGFTLIELMVVVLIIGILVAIAVPKFLNAQNGAKAKAAQANARSAEAVLAAVVTDKGDYNNVNIANLKAADPMFQLAEKVKSTKPSEISWARMKASGATQTYASAANASDVTPDALGVQIAVSAVDGTCYIVDTMNGATTFAKVASSALPTAGCAAGATFTPAITLSGDVSVWG